MPSGGSGSQAPVDAGSIDSKTNLAPVGDTLGETSTPGTSVAAPEGGAGVPVPSALAEIAGAEGVDRAVEILRGGGLVGMPTETVYGLAADATNEAALQRLYRVKRRPAAHPVIVHLASAEDIHHWAAEVSPLAEELARCFWPGPLTLVVKRAAHVTDAITGGADTVALRVPKHPVAQALLQALRAAKAADAGANSDSAQVIAGLAAPSANRFGKVSPTTARHVQWDLALDVDLILDGGPCEVGIESTIIDVSGGSATILRPGGISATQIEDKLQSDLGSASAQSPTVPGSLPTHYAPRAKARLAKRMEIIEALATNRGRRIAVLALEVAVSRLAASLSIVEPAVPARYARNLYANLRTLDSTGADLILIESPPDTPSWTAVLDRLRRATAGEEASAKTGKRKKAVEKTEEATLDVLPATSTSESWQWPCAPVSAASLRVTPILEPWHWPRAASGHEPLTATPLLAPWRWPCAS